MERTLGNGGSIKCEKAAKQHRLDVKGCLNHQQIVIVHQFISNSDHFSEDRSRVCCLLVTIHYNFLQRFCSFKENLIL